ncbi:MAG: choice-of-anchor Q domain-containing protein, partial [Chloroflexota bacterium]
MMAGRKLFSLFVLLVVVFSQFAQPHRASAATIRYVAASGGLDTGQCDSWANACTLQRALFVAGGGDEIWVQQGTYKPTSGTDRSASFIIPDGVAVYGGFLGTETARDQRNPNPANTILSGEIGDQNLLTDNSFHVVTIDNAGAATRLDGFTITRGYVADADGNPYGGGIYITNSSPVLNNLIITENRAGNTVGSGGGGVYIDDTDGLPLITPTISNVTFLNNYSGRGGGLFSQRSSPVLTNVVFQGNQALATGGGGANFQTLNATDPAINPVLTNVSFINNTATGGGGMFLGNSTGSLTNVTFSGNVANRRGGGLLLEFSSVVLTNVTFYNNTSNNNLADPKGGGGVMVIASNPTLNNVTFSGNTSNANGASGGAMRVVKDPASPTVSNPLIRNAIFWGDNSTEITSDGTGSITVNDSIVQGGCPSGATCTNVLNSNPQLGALASNGGFTQTMALGLGSPAINAGNNSTCASADQRGVARPQWSTCDMGAFEAGAHIDNAASDFSAGTVGSCVVDNLIGDGAVRLNLPGSTTCTFESRVFDA